MKTINELYIYFMCCFIFATLFITYLSVKLRAYRIKNASLTNRIEIADKDITDAYDEVEKANIELTDIRTKSADIINQSAENNAKLVLEIESLKANEEALKLFYETQIETLKSDRQKLFDIAKGATAKLAEMNIALEGLEVKEEKKEGFKVGDYIQGRIIGLKRDEIGEVTDVDFEGHPRVNTWYLNKNTCKRVSRPILL